MNPPLTTPAGRQVPDWVILAIACVAQFMVVLDVSIVNVALPSIGTDLHYSPVGLQWVVNAYVLTFAGFLLLGGRAADIFGRRRVYMFGMALFSIASLVGGFAQNSGWLTAARAAQGVGGAFLSPATLTIIVTTFSGARLAKALGMWSAVAGAGGAIGSILGGVLTSQLSWRWVLYVNVPIGIVAIIAAATFLTETKRAAIGQKLDIGGAITVTAGLSTLAYGVVGTSTYGWTSTRTLAILAVALVLLAIFAVIQVRFAKTPLVPFDLFRSRSVSGANIVMFLVGAAFFSMWYFLSLYMQRVHDFGPLKTGLLFVPNALSIILGAQISARLITRFGVRPMMLTGTLFATGGFIWLSQIQATSNYWSHVLGPACIVAFSLGLLFTPLAAAATAGVQQTRAGLASGVLNTSRQVGGALGLAVLATIATDYARARGSLSHIASVRDVALTAGYTRAFTVAAGLVFLAFCAAFIVPSIRPRHQRAQQVEPIVADMGGPGTAPPEPAGVGAARDPDPA